MHPDQADSSTDECALSVALRGVWRHFGERTVLRDLSCACSEGQTLVITGQNGSGKSTVLKLIAGLLAPSAGEVSVKVDGARQSLTMRRRHIAYVSPDLSLYNELTGAENMHFFARLKGVRLDDADLKDCLHAVGLKGRGRDVVGDYSTGMRQRLKYAVALLGRPPIAVWDEPTTNLDSAGIEITRRLLQEQVRRVRGGLAILATNNAHEEAWGDLALQLSPP
ncbi:MAG TPA: ABC transporter ATP-binding protein [Chthonomonadales bacterium]|nr:ABC transporter ATP-binding protein [Chthonomonadales bacterium]